MYQCIIENEYGDQLELTNNANYSIYRIDGLEPPKANINTSLVANFDGSRFNSSRTGERNIVIQLAIEGDCEVNRTNLYKYVKSKRYIKFYYKNATRNVYAEGYVEEMAIGFFEQKQTVQISILCPYPYFKSVKNDIIEFASLTGLFAFPFAIEEAGIPFSTVTMAEQQIVTNGGDIENGLIITIRAIGRALNPVVYNLVKNEFFKINVDMFSGDEIIINTNKSQKKVTLNHNGVTTNIINSMVRGSQWFQLVAGDNLFLYSADEYPENLQCTLTRQDEYEGV